jgi:uncharacterized protein YecE (DUF72 family)
MILIGTSGYSFPDWVGPFYPPGIERVRMLDYYVRHFPTVEVNSTYYRIPPPSTLHAMERKTPEGFEFVVKAHHDMTHVQSLDSELYRSLARAVEPLRIAGKLSGVLAQFPYSFRRCEDHETFLIEMKRRLPDTPLFVEFRHASWIRDDLFPWLQEHGLGYVSVDEPDLPGLVPPLARATGDIAYVRLHGRNKENWWGKGGTRGGAEGRRAGATRGAPTGGAPTRSRQPVSAPASFGPLFAADRPAAPGPTGTSSDRYDYMYSEAELQEWVKKIRELSAKVKKTFVFFNNCHVGQAATGAKLMRKLLEGEGLL